MDRAFFRLATGLQVGASTRRIRVEWVRGLSGGFLWWIPGGILYFRFRRRQYRFSVRANSTVSRCVKRPWTTQALEIWAVAIGSGLDCACGAVRARV